MSTGTILAIYRRLFAVLDNIQEAYWLLREGAVADADLCGDLIEQLAAAGRAAEEWRRLLEGGDNVH